MISLLSHRVMSFIVHIVIPLMDGIKRSYFSDVIKYSSSDVIKCSLRCH